MRMTRNRTEIAKEFNGYVVADVPDPADATKLSLQKGKQVPSFAVLRDDGSTSCGCWIYSGSFTEAGNNMARRDNERSGRHRRVSRSGRSRGPPTAASSTTAPRRTCRARPWDPKRKLIEWDGTKWAGYDVPDIAPTAEAGRRCSPSS